jgi:hypothetical protein
LDDDTIEASLVMVAIWRITRKTCENEPLTQASAR